MSSYDRVRHAAGLLFGAAAESYERFRLGYPDEVVDRTLDYAARPLRTAIEVGSGTGKATRAFASRGIHITALEPDRNMFLVLQRESAGMSVRPVLSQLEDYDGPPVDLVYAASNWHGTEPTNRWSRTSRLLVADGVVASFGRPMTLVDENLRAAVEEVRRSILPNESLPQPGSQEGSEWPASELDGSDFFLDVQRLCLPREVVVPQKEYVGFLSTVSAYLQLTVRQRQDVLLRIVELLPEHVRLDAGVRLCLGRKAG
jgi:SAM-dependent methyltransferase